jgi:hypothetical protein
MAERLRASKEMRDNLQKLCDNWQWLHNNLAAVQEKYAGKWVAITEARVVGAGSTPQDVKAGLAGSYRQEESLILYVPEGEVSRPI